MSTVVSGQALTIILNSTLSAVDAVMNMPIERGQPRLVQAPLLQTEIGVLIGLTHGVRGRLILQAGRSVFSGIGQAMYGMALEGDMLESFVGELGNMIAGNMSTTAAGEGLSVEISPPTVLVGETKLSGFGTALLVPVSIAGSGKLDIIMVLDQD